MNKARLPKHRHAVAFLMLSLLGLVWVSSASAQDAPTRSQPTEDEVVPEEATVEVKVVSPGVVEKQVVPNLQKPQLVKPTNQKGKIVLTDEERAAIETLIWGHVEHVNTRNLDGYMADFRKGSEVHLSYAKRVIEELEPSLELLSFDISAFNKTTATVLVVQRAHLTESGTPRVDVVELTYRLRKIDPGWKIDSTSRTPLLPEDYADQPGLEKP